MNKIVVAINPSKDEKNLVRDLICKKLNDAFENIEILVVNSFEIKNCDLTNTDILMVLGGDGTLLGVARDISNNYDIPILGINIGNLGFLSSVDIKDLDKAIDKIKKNEYNIQDRTMLRCYVKESDREKNGVALNDVVISRGTLSRMIKFNVVIDGKTYSSFKGDGLIIATPTGSTAYSFSAGGPFIYPSVDVITLTPICPHSKSMQPMVLSSDSVIELQAENNNDEIYVTFDGQKSIKIDDKSIIKIEKSDTYAKILLFDDYDYFKVLQAKILNK